MMKPSFALLPGLSGARRAALARVSLCALALALVGCSDTDDDGDSPGAEQGAPIFVGTTRVFTPPESSRGYMYTFSALDEAEGDEIDLKRAREMDDAWVFGDAKPYFYTATIFSPSITQWSLDEQGDFVEGPEVSFANEGVMGTYSAAFTPVYSAEKSYFVDSDSAQVVVWSPKDVTFLKTIPIDVDLPEDHEGPADLTPTLDISVQKGRIVVTVFWNSFDSGWTKMASFTRLVVIDTETDEVTDVTDKPGCASISPIGTTSDGTTYYGAWDYHVAGAAVFGEGFGAASCALRMKANEVELDDDFEVDLSDVTGGPTGSAFLVNDDEMLLHVWKPELSTATPENWTDEGRWQPSYEWYRWTIGEDSAKPLPKQEPSGEGSSWAKIDGRLFSYAANSEYSETTLVELNADGTTTAVRTVPGWTSATIRAR